MKRIVLALAIFCSSPLVLAVAPSSSPESVPTQQITSATGEVLRPMNGDPRAFVVHRISFCIGSRQPPSQRHSSAGYSLRFLSSTLTDEIQRRPDLFRGSLVLVQEVWAGTADRCSVMEFELASEAVGRLKVFAPEAMPTLVLESGDRTRIVASRRVQQAVTRSHQARRIADE